MEDDKKLYTGFLKEGYFPRGSDLVIDVLTSMIFIFLMIGSIIYLNFSYWIIIPIIMVLFYCYLNGKPRWLTTKISVHWNRMYKLRDKWEIAFRKNVL